MRRIPATVRLLSHRDFRLLWSGLAAYAPADFARLAWLKAKYDPGNTLRVNLNISPQRKDTPT